MLQSVRPWLAPLAALLLAAWRPSCAQQPAELPPVHVPVKPADRKELDHVEALKAFALGLLAEKDNRLIEAVQEYEEAVRLDPDAAAPLRALAPLYVALDRTDDALDACRKALELDPDDADTGYFYARQLRAADKTPEAVAAFARTAALPRAQGKAGASSANLRRPGRPVRDGRRPETGRSRLPRCGRHPRQAGRADGTGADHPPGDRRTGGRDLRTAGPPLPQGRPPPSGPRPTSSRPAKRTPAAPAVSPMTWPRSTPDRARTARRWNGSTSTCKRSRSASRATNSGSRCSASSAPTPTS